MTSKKFLLILIIVFSLFAFCKINAQNTSSNNPDIENVKNLIQEKTPAFIAKPIITTTNALENFRKNTGEKFTIKREEAKKGIKNSKTSKFFQYAKLSFFRLVSFVFNNQFIFYIVLFTIISLIIRSIWMKIF